MLDKALVDNRRAQLRRYIPWLARDYFMNQGPATAIVLLLIGFLSIAGSRGGLGEMPPEIGHRILRQLAGMLAFLGTFFATNGIVANDRKLGYYKFLFSKPVRPPAYYGLTFVVYGIGLLAVSAALLALWALTVQREYPVELFVVIAVMYLAYGGIGFLLSAAWRFDWLSLVTVIFAANVAWTFWQHETGLRFWVIHLLPPVHRTDSIYALVVRGPADPIPWTSIGWLAGYGLACFLLGMVVIRKRSLGTS